MLKKLPLPRVGEALWIRCQLVPGVYWRDLRATINATHLHSQFLNGSSNDSLQDRATRELRDQGFMCLFAPEVV
jgi:hypothetical protein